MHAEETARKAARLAAARCKQWLPNLPAAATAATVRNATRHATARARRAAARSHARAAR
jgi:hypothetical protein